MNPVEKTILDCAELNALVGFYATESYKYNHNYEVEISAQISNSICIPVTNWVCRKCQEYEIRQYRRLRHYCQKINENVL